MHERARFRNLRQRRVQWLGKSRVLTANIQHRNR